MRKEMRSRERNQSAPNADPESSWQRTRIVYHAANADTLSSTRKSKEGKSSFGLLPLKRKTSGSPGSSTGQTTSPSRLFLIISIWTSGVAWISRRLPKPFTRVRIPTGPPLSDILISAYSDSIHMCEHSKVTENCPCKKTECPRHGKCCECVAFHREKKNKLPCCLRDIKFTE